MEYNQIQEKRDRKKEERNSENNNLLYALLTGTMIAVGAAGFGIGYITGTYSHLKFHHAELKKNSAVEQIQEPQLGETHIQTIKSDISNRLK